MLDRTMLDQGWTLSPSVALRPEPFGALAYHFGNRKLIFLKRPELVRIVEALGTVPTARHALDIIGVPGSDHHIYAAALAGLASADMICLRSGELP